MPRYEDEKELQRLNYCKGEQEWKPGRVVTYQPPMAWEQAKRAAEDIRRLESIFRS